MKVFSIALAALFSFSLFSCGKKVAPPSPAFQQQWYAGKAELSSYTLEQARYGELRQGEAVLVFVSEDFLTGPLVKPDHPEKESDKIRVLKMNMTKKFVTGIYPYSMMLSVFTPASEDGEERTLKVTATVQEWCGQTYSSLKRKGSAYNWTLHSYFEQEGEQEEKLDDAVPEDELWNRIRINPAALPQGKAKVLPGLFWQRLSHTTMKAEEATLTLSTADTFFIKEPNVQLYTIYYPQVQRTLQIYFRSPFPHEILGWQERYPDGFGAAKKMLTTKAVRKKTIWLDYWKHNANSDSTYRDSLQLLHP